MDTVPETTDALQDRHQQQAITLLQKSRTDLDSAIRGRIRTAHLARAYGLTNQAIADQLGITEGGVRALLTRNPLDDVAQADR